MKIIRFCADDSIPHSACPLLLGNFDGFHLGHMDLVDAGRESGGFAILLLDPPFQKEGAQKPLMTLGDKIAFVERNGAEAAFVLKTSDHLFSLSKEEFLASVLKRMDPPLLIVGEDYRFGKGAAGGIEDLKRLFATKVIPLRTEGGEKIGTRQIKGFLQSGEIEKANEELGRPYCVRGIVQRGFQNGRKIGFPTANLRSLPYFLPSKGVYGGLSYLRGRPYLSIVNVGDAPTVGKLREDIVEAYLDGFDGECYGETLYVEFLFKIRDERKFESLGDLKEQLEKDLKGARDRL